MERVGELRRVSCGEPQDGSSFDFQSIPSDQKNLIDRGRWNFEAIKTAEKWEVGRRHVPSEERRRHIRPEWQGNEAPRKGVAFTSKPKLRTNRQNEHYEEIRWYETCGTQKSPQRGRDVARGQLQAFDLEAILESRLCNNDRETCIATGV